MNLFKRLASRSRLGRPAPTMGGTNLELSRCADALEILARLAAIVAKEEYDQDILTPASRLPKFDPEVSYASQGELAFRRVEAELSGLRLEDDSDPVTYENVKVHGDTLSPEEIEFMRSFDP